MQFPFVIFVALAVALGISAPEDTGAAAAAKRMERKLDYLVHNSRRPSPDPKPTVLTQEEVNAYFSEGKVQLPQGVQSVTFQGEPGRITAVARVDFDEVRRGRQSANPLLAVFTGVHDVKVAAQAEGAEGKGVVKVESVAIDGVTVPRVLLELFVERFVQPRYPKVGLESEFQMPARIHTALVGQEQISLIQR